MIEVANLLSALFLAAAFLLGTTAAFIFKKHDLLEYYSLIHKREWITARIKARKKPAGEEKKKKKAAPSPDVDEGGTETADLEKKPEPYDDIDLEIIYEDSMPEEGLTQVLNGNADTDVLKKRELVRQKSYGDDLWWIPTKKFRIVRDVKIIHTDKLLSGRRRED